METDVARQKKFAAGGPFPASALLFFAQMRLFAEREFAGAWEGFGGIGDRRNNMSQIASTGLTLD